MESVVSHPEILPVTLPILNVIYLDDEENAILNLEGKVKLYNRNVESSQFKIRLTSFQTWEEVYDLLKSAADQYHVFLCDHNMPQRQGLEFITQLLIQRFSNLLYVLYTGAGNLNDEVKSVCQQHDILYFVKSESFTTLVERIHQKLRTKRRNSPEDLYDLIAKDVIKDLMQMKDLDPNFQITIGEVSYSSAQLLDAIKSKSELGVQHLMNYVEGLKFFKSK